MLVFAGMELIFSIGASMGLYFEFVLKTVLTIQGSFVIAGQSSHRAKAFLPLTPPGRRLGEDRLGQLTTAGQRDAPDHVASSSARGGGWGGCLE